MSCQNHRSVKEVIQTFKSKPPRLLRAHERFWCQIQNSRRNKHQILLSSGGELRDDLVTFVLVHLQERARRRNRVMHDKHKCSQTSWCFKVLFTLNFISFADFLNPRSDNDCSYSHTDASKSLPWLIAPVYYFKRRCCPSFLLTSSHVSRYTSVDWRLWPQIRILPRVQRQNQMFLSQDVMFSVSRT